MKAAYGLSCCESSRFGEGDIAGKNGEDDPNEFLHSVGHSNVIMLPLRPFTVDIGTERNRINVSHIGSAVERPAKITRTVFYHRRVGSGVFAGLVGRRFATGKSKKFIGVVEVLNIADFGKDGSTEQIAYTGNRSNGRIEFSHNGIDFFFNLGHLRRKEQNTLNSLF